MTAHTSHQLQKPARIVHIIECDADLRAMQVRMDMLEQQVARWMSWHAYIAAALIIVAIITFVRPCMPALLAHLLP